MYVCMYVCAPHARRIFGGQKKVSDHLEPGVIDVSTACGFWECEQEQLSSHRTVYLYRI